MGELAHKPQHRWDDDTKQAVITDYAHTGSAASTHRNFPQVPYETIRSIVQTDEAVDLITTLHEAKATEHRQAYSRLVDKSLAKAEQGIDKLGDDLSAGDIRSLIVSGAVGTDKIRLADNLPGSITSRSDDSIESLARTFKQLSDSFEEKNANTVLTIDKQGSHTT